MRRLLGVLCLVVAVLLPAIPEAVARESWHGDIHRFRGHDSHLWRQGRWHQGRHGGRIGWWWIVGGVWYFYASPIYPYPDPYRPPVVVVPPAPVPGPTLWYYCANPPGYYPYVPQCSMPWQAVPAR